MSTFSITDQPVQKINRLKDIVICPGCKGELGFDIKQIRCLECGSVYSISRGVPLLCAEQEVPLEGRGHRKSTEYALNYQTVERAKRYNLKYRKQPFKKWSTHRELRLLRHFLKDQPDCGIILDIPSGGGRLSEPLAEKAKLLLEADVAVGQVLYGLSLSPGRDHQVWINASAFHLPLGPGSVDGAVCIRLSHHLASPEERERLLREMIRVSKSFTIFSFFDFYSLKNVLRRIRRPIDGKEPKKTMKYSRVAAIAREEGATLRFCPRLSVIGSGHRYALLLKDRS